MRPAVITGANANPGAPRDWDPERDGVCGKLPIKVTTQKLNGDCGVWPPGPGERLLARVRTLERTLAMLG